MGKHLAFEDDISPVHNLQRPLHVMVRHEHGNVSMVAQRTNLLLQLFDGHRINSAERFVQQDQ